MNDAEREAIDALRTILSESQQRNGQAAEAYAALKASGKLKGHRLIAYRCAARNCLLLDVVQVPGQVICHSPAYKLSPRRNAESSNASGRTANTRDGNRHWKAHTYDVGSAVNFLLHCDHVPGVLLEKGQLQADVDARHAEVTVDADGCRMPR